MQRWARKPHEKQAGEPAPPSTPLPSAASSPLRVSDTGARHCRHRAEVRKSCTRAAREGKLAGATVAAAAVEEEEEHGEEEEEEDEEKGAPRSQAPVTSAASKYSTPQSLSKKVAKRAGVAKAVVRALVLPEL
jgi:hypothetical protein